MKNKQDLSEIIIMKEGLFSINICTTISPKKIKEIPNKINEIQPSGTMSGWNNPDFEEYPELKPVKCKDYDNRWHYVLLA